MAQLADQEIKLTNLEELKPHPKNPKLSDVGTIGASIDANGFYGVVVAQRSTGFIVAGHGRAKAAEEAGLTEIPVAWIDCDDETAERILAVDNRSGEVGEYDASLLSDLLQGIKQAGGLEGTGYRPEDLDELLASLAPAFAPELQPTVSAKEFDSGDVSKAADKLANGVPAPVQLRNVMCPHCGETFGIDE